MKLLEREIFDRRFRTVGHWNFRERKQNQYLMMKKKSLFFGGFIEGTTTVKVSAKEKEKKIGDSQPFRERTLPV
jgi:hypothetical protein